MARQWVLTGQEGFEKSLEFQENVLVPSAGQLGPSDVLVKLHAASLNYRELNIANPMSINGPITPPVIPGCDGAGVIEAIGVSVQEFKPGDRVITHMAPRAAESKGDEAILSLEDGLTALGQVVDGTLRSRGVFSEKALVHAPKSLDWLLAATLSCNWVTAWNILFGSRGKEIGPNSWVLVQGTGGASIAVLQIAAAAGAAVVASTSTEEKEMRLRGLGATHTVNYRTNPDNWGHEARKLTPEGRGFDIVVDIGGYESLPQSLASVRVDGMVVPIGMMGGNAEPVSLFATLQHTCTVRGIIGGSRAQMKEAVGFIDKNGIKPAVDDVVFELAEAKDAYQRLKDKKHFSKVLIKIEHPE